MIHDDSSPSATKQDVQILLEAIQDVKVVMLAQDEMLQKQINGLATKDELYAVKEELQEDMQQRIDGVFLKIEDVQTKIVDFHKDGFTGHSQKIAEHNKRIHKLEVHTGLAV